MHQDDSLNQLLTLGLTTYESKGYLALLQKQSSTASELARLSGIPRTRIYDVLERLTLNGMCVELLGKEKKYQAVAPDIALQRLVEHQKTDILSKETLAKALAQTLTDHFKKGSTNNDPLDYIELLRDPQQVARKVMQLVSEAQSEILAFVKPPFSNPKRELEKQNEKSIQASARHIAIRAIYEIPKGDEEAIWMLGQIERSVESGEQARVIDNLPLKLVIVDEHKVVFAMEDYLKTKSQQTSLLIEHHALAQGLKILFETLWEKAWDYKKMAVYAESKRS